MPLPDHVTILRQTDWESLEQPFPDQIVVANELVDLLDDDPAVRVKALGALREAGNHQNTIYQVTPPLAQYVAALLADQRTEAVASYRRNKPPVSLRVALLDWLGFIANDASDEVVAGAARFGFGTSPAMEEFRSMRPSLFDVVEKFAGHPDEATRCAAVTACLLLLDNVEERGRHRERFAPLVAEILDSSVDGYYRDRAIESLEAWGEPTEGLRRDEEWFPSWPDFSEPATGNPSGPSYPSWPA